MLSLSQTLDIVAILHLKYNIYAQFYILRHIVKVCKLSSG
nr:MAG TPA: hypothetical protein [Caudoviricetes sp.]